MRKKNLFVSIVMAVVFIAIIVLAPRPICDMNSEIAEIQRVEATQLATINSASFEAHQIIQEANEQIKVVRNQCK